jgi:glycosyltransferase involved in cell wall biosynthesis
VRELVRGCRAFLFPGLEDFGIAPVEAMSSGRPVIAYAGGGALDTVAPGVSGELFATQSAENLAELLQSFDYQSYSPEACRHQAERFSAEAFRRHLLARLTEALQMPAAS